MLRINRAICCYCGTCVAVCTGSALTLIDAFLSVGEGCRQCGVCEKICPVGALEVIHEEQV